MSSISHSEAGIKPRKDLLDIAGLSRAEIDFLLEAAGPMKELFTRSVKKTPHLRGKTVLNLFYENSTRTSSSFEVAASRLSADVTNFGVSSSSVQKGESVIDTVDTLQAMRTDYVVIRHSKAGVPGMVAKHIKASVINAGDGFHAHPTQALLDAFTMREIYPDLNGKKVLIVGDIQHSRVARSTSTILNKLGASVGVLGPSTLVPSGRHDFMQKKRDWKEALEWSPDFVYLLRVQHERQGEVFFPSISEYHQTYGLTTERYREIAARGTYLMHPGPVNRGTEIVDEAMTYERSLINTQVENGIAVRMAVLYFLRPHTQSEGAV